MSTTTQPERTQAEAAQKRKPVSRKVGEIADDLATLAELQAQLFAVDAKECSARISPSLGMLAGAVALGLGACPILLAAIGLTLHEVFELSYAASFWIATLLGLVIAVGLGYAGQQGFRQSMSVFKRSHHELMRNLRWIRYVLQHHR